MRIAKIDTAFSVLLALLACWIIYHALRFGLTSPSGIGGGLFPLIAGITILACSIANLFDKVERGTLQALTLDWPTLRPVALMVGTTAGFIALIPVFGMIFLTFPLVVAVSWIIERPASARAHIVVVVVAACTTAALYYLFARVLNIPLPWGIFDE